MSSLMQTELVIATSDPAGKSCVYVFPVTELLLLLLRFSQKNIQYSASYVLTKKTLSNVKAKSTIKITYFSGFQHCIIEMTTSKRGTKT
jgi:hypothetical protein